MSVPVFVSQELQAPGPSSFTTVDEAVDYVRVWDVKMADRLEEVRGDLLDDEGRDLDMASLADAVALLRQLSRYREPTVGLNDDGQLSAFWSKRNGAASLSLKFLGDGHVQYAAKRGDHDHNFGGISLNPAASLFPWYLDDERGPSEWKTSQFPTIFTLRGSVVEDTSTRVRVLYSQGHLSFELEKSTRRETVLTASAPPETPAPLSSFGPYFRSTPRRGRSPDSG